MNEKLIEVFSQNGDNPFICFTNGRFTILDLLEIEADINENPCFEKGDGIYRFCVNRIAGQYGFEGRCEAEPGWELTEVGFEPWPPRCAE